MFFLKYCLLFPFLVYLPLQTQMPVFLYGAEEGEEGMRYI